MNDGSSSGRAGSAALGIEPTSDIRAIKRAYAGVLKTIDLATDPERFARLRADYEAALEQAPHIAARSADASVSSEMPVFMPSAAGEPDSAHQAAVSSEAAFDRAEPRWTLSDTSPRYRLKSAYKSVGDIDNVLGWLPRMPSARMPAALPLRRGEAASMAREDDVESAAFAALLDDHMPDRPRLLEAGLRRYGWDMVGSDLGGFASYQGWLTQLLAERARWQSEKPRRRRKKEAYLARIAAAPPSGSIGDLYLWRQFAETSQAYPLWTAFSVGSYRLDEWTTTATQAPAWKRWLARSRERPLLLLFLIWILTTVVSSLLTNAAGRDTAWIILTVFGAVQMVLLVLMAAAIGQSIGRRMQRKT